MQKLFYTLGRAVYTLRWVIILLWIGALGVCIPFLPHVMAPFSSTGFIDEQSPSAKTQRLIDDKLGFNKDNQFVILYTSKELNASNPQFIQKIKDSLAELEHFAIPHVIILPSDNPQQISKDKHTAIAVVIIKSQQLLNESQVKELKAAIKPPNNMQMRVGGERIFVNDMNKQTQVDLYKADYIATPVAIVIMVVVFGSLISALLPILLGAGCALMILTGLFGLGHVYTLSVYTLNIALLLGLCLSLDYALFIISRFREELNSDVPIKESIARTQATAGKAIFFSGLAVFVSLSALLLFPITILFSVAVGGLVAVLIAVVTATVFLPALLAVLKHRINWLSVRSFKKSATRSTAWHWLATRVVKRPMRFFCFILAVLLVLGYPLWSAHFGVSDYRIFPKNSDNRTFFDEYEKKFDINALSPITVLIQSQKRILSQANLKKLQDFTETLLTNPSIKHIHSIVTTNSSLTPSQYHRLYNAEDKPDSINTLLNTSTGTHFTVMQLTSRYKPDTVQTKDLLETLRNTKLPEGFTLQLTGTSASNQEVLKSISKRLIPALVWILAFTFLILLVLLRSLVLPLQAIIMNLLSLSACYGALVWIFQEGHLHQWLHFDPQGELDISLLVIIFCALFGFSMDYEVFLLSRIRESYDATHDNENSIVLGIEKSGRIITSAAIIVISICFSFLVAEVLMVKAFGVGIAVAIFVDAFLIRTLLVPSCMVLLKSSNWYLPRWLNKILSRRIKT